MKTQYVDQIFNRSCALFKLEKHLIVKFSFWKTRKNSILIFQRIFSKKKQKKLETWRIVLQTIQLKNSFFFYSRYFSLIFSAKFSTIKKFQMKQEEKQNFNFSYQQKCTSFPLFQVEIERNQLFFNCSWNFSLVQVEPNLWFWEGEGRTKVQVLGKIEARAREPCLMDKNRSRRTFSRRIEPFGIQVWWSIKHELLWKEEEEEKRYSKVLFFWLSTEKKIDN